MYDMMYEGDINYIFITHLFLQFFDRNVKAYYVYCAFVYNMYSVHV